MYQNSFYDGIVAFEQKCEEIMANLDISDEAAMFIQTQILDKAQNECERQYAELCGS